MDADLSKAFVMAAIRRLVDDELAEWDRTKDGELELRLVTGEIFVVGETAIRSKKRSRRIAPMLSIHHRWWGAA